MPEKDVDEQFAAIVARWSDEARGQDPFGDPEADSDDSNDADDADDADDPDDLAGADPHTATSPSAPVGAASTAPVKAVNPAPGPRDHPHDVDAPDDDEVLESVELPEDEDAHFEPPPPAPLPPSEDKHFWVMLGALIGGPLLFLYLLLFNRDGNGWWMTFALLLAVAGFVLLVLRQPLDRDEDDDGIRL